MTLLRRLPVGIIVADSGDRLRGSNQSAETILGIPLPRRDDAASRNVAYATRNVFQDTIVLCDEDGKERKAASYGETIPGERRRGQESSYYAKLVQGRSKDRWVRVMAMPIPIGRDPRDGAPTFAAIMKVDETKEKDLNQMAESFKEIAS